MPIKSKPALVATRVGLDQFAFAPVAVGLFFSCTGLMEGKSLEQVKQKLNSSYKDTLIANWMLFIPFQTINMFIPLHHRLLAVNAVSIPWNAFLSWKGASVSKTVVA
ncbi:Protein SYM1 OS=Cryptococcus neoformans var, neoformans serotype D (strain JEC21 / ATCC MYA-565) GN=SYM1 PE=3 SV=1 [Rhizoctonia solani AG-1 IB]|uniref:Protein SYM1 n=1 Tax=Thanatephorus cucumeris (strain AG1-IB / isolate 7/3/14) TaxID=1108050 RepID=A0A0B7F8R4_THACB|nr:Protein SYM1 OS=Cryptococcus neoformans var, neoformans serotype D (strain JEC21 / ATCC MYA-565) GN=SYM1 PE=3 SV=1 [Rhizoctonia solani AG-1 IB]